MVRIRVATPADGAAMTAIYGPIVRETAISFEAEPPSAEAMAERVRQTLNRHPWVVAERDGAVVGYAYAGPHQDRAAYRWSCNFSAYVATPLRRAGVGSALYGALTAITRAQGCRSAFAGITLPNEASVALHEAVGFRPLGVYEEVGYKLGRWLAVGWWRLPLSQEAGPPGEPLPFAAMIGTAELAELLLAPASLSRT